MDPIRAFLNTHLQEKNFNHQAWLGDFLEGQAEPTEFPYRYSTGTGTLIDNTFTPEDEQPLNLNLPVDNKPVYILNIPFVPSLDPAKANEKLNKLIAIIREQSFGHRTEDSIGEVARRIIVVFGMNRPVSIDISDTQLFTSWIYKLPAIQGLQCMVVGKLWNTYVELSSKAKKKKGTYYPVQRAFKLLKVLNANRAKDVKTFFGEDENQKTNFRKQIPFQKIREWITKTTLNLPGLNALFARRTTYLGIMDDDPVAFRMDGQGLFSEYDSLVVEKTTQILGPPMLMSTGYFAPQQASRTTELSLLIDMNIRTGMSQAIPLSPYFPEPNTMLLLNDPNIRNRISFIGPGHDTENRRLLTKLKTVLVSERIFFIFKKCFITSIPDRMEASKKVYNLNASVIGQKQILKALRGISQTHLDPLIWATNVYMSLPIKTRNVGKIKSTLTHIFNSFDPINLAQTLALYFTTNYNYIYIVHIQKEYDTLSNNMLQAAQDNLQVENLAAQWAAAVAGFGEDQNSYISFFKTQAEILTDALNDLRNIYELDDEWCQKVLRAGFFSGRGIYQALHMNVAGL